MASAALARRRARREREAAIARAEAAPGRADDAAASTHAAIPSVHGDEHGDTAAERHDGPRDGGRAGGGADAAPNGYVEGHDDFSTRVRGYVNRETQAKHRTTCPVCLVDKRGTSFSWYQFRKKEAHARRCLLCTDRRRAELFDESRKAFGPPRYDDDVFEAAAAGNMARVMLEVEEGGAVDRKSATSGRTMLQEAAAAGQEDVCEYLCDAGADVKTRALVARETALHLAVWNDHVAIALMLLAFGAEPMRRNRYGQIAMHYCRSVETAKPLMWALDTHVVYDKQGRTPAMLCAARGDADVVDWVSEVERRRVLDHAKEVYEAQQAELQKKQAKIDAREAKLSSAADRTAKEKAVREYMEWKAGKKGVTLAQLKSNKASAGERRHHKRLAAYADDDPYNPYRKGRSELEGARRSSRAALPGSAGAGEARGGAGARRGRRRSSVIVAPGLEGAVDAPPDAR